MINRRIAIFALIGILVLTAFTLREKLVSDDISKVTDDIEIVSSDDSILDIVEDDGMRKTVLYFQDENGYIVPVMRRIPWEEGIAKVTLRNMIDTSELRESLGTTGLIPLIPSGTEINGITIDPDTAICKVDFSEEFLNKETQKEEENLIKGVVYTLTEFPTINEVKIMVEGQELNTLKNGTNIASTLSRDNINLLGNAEDGRSNVVVYYKGSTDTDFEYFVPVTIPTMAPVSNVFTALDLLFEGPPEDSGLLSDIPLDAEFQGVEVKDGTAYVDINLGAESMLTIESTVDDLIKNIGLTLSEFDEIESVEVLVGEEIINTSIPVFANEY
ncbi:GerMN domain-containing protein [Tissierella sp. Yu-01]|uniref:GerMN domain-containing protein n=1 Tax=Tissierella sp. Yu-01 TaxID=3035694 RepID=UPI00240D172E|nr:GerMN domain-containing protein [Tissierella sp. Yu-01]WFA08921.1 GerMN domain-containing protein [Tissierella sp. Yu-01]